MLAPVRATADLIIDTSTLSVGGLKGMASSVPSAPVMAARPQRHR